MDLIESILSNPVFREYVLGPLPWILLMIFIVLTLVAYLVYAERKISAFMQARLGPMRVGPYGLLQPLADLVKLITKEDIIPSRADPAIFTLAPVISVVAALVGLAILPFGPGKATLTDINIGVLFILAVSSVGILGIILGGWASNSKYPLLGAMRSAAQLVSYEVAQALAVVGALMFAKSLSLSGLVQAQANDHIWYIFYQPLGFMIFFIGSLAETNRAPFDLPEGESEIVAGYHTEYSGFRWSLYFLAEYAAIMVSSAVAVTVFLGGWYLPYLGRIASGRPTLFVLLSIGVFAGKMLIVIYLIMWFRWTFPRYRYDQLMDLGWKWLIPAALANVVLSGVVIVLGQEWGLIRTVRFASGEQIVTSWPGSFLGKFYAVGTGFFVLIPITWILLAVINRHGYDFNLRVQRQLPRVKVQRGEEGFSQV